MREHYQKWVPAVYTDKWLFSDGGKYSITYSRYSQDELNKYQYQLTCEINLEPSLTADVKYTNFTLLEYDKREDIKWRTDQLDDVHVVCRCYISKPYSPLYKNGVYLMDTVTKVEFAKSLLNQNTQNWSEPETITGYRVFTPGHWEDADGNWINGSWSDKDTNVWIPINGNSFMAYFGDNMFGQQFDQPQWVVSVHGHSPNSVSNYDPNANFLETTCELPMTQYGTRIWTNTVPEPNT